MKNILMRIYSNIYELLLPDILKLLLTPKAIENGTPKTRKPIGLTNFGNSCFLNAIIQVCTL